MNTANLNIPSAEELEKYEQIKPGYSDRILTLIEKDNEFTQTAFIKEYNTKTILSAFYIILLFGFLCKQFSYLKLNHREFVCLT